MRKTWISSLKIVLVIIGIFSALLWIEKTDHLPVRMSASLPRPIQPDGLTITIDKTQFAYDYIVEVAFTGQLLLKTEDKTYNLRRPLRAKISPYKCTRADSGIFTCRILLHSDGEEIKLQLLRRRAAWLHSVNVFAVKESQISSLNEKNAIYGIIGLLGLILTVNLLRRHPELCQWLMITGAVGFLLLNHIVFTVILLALLYACYRWREKIRFKAPNQDYRLAFVVGIAVAFLALFKYFQEATVSVFADPGNFNFVLPLGISYFIIRLIDTLMRWYRGEQMNVTLREFLCFILFPGTLIAGPIETIDQFYKKRLTHIGKDDIAYMLYRVCIGLFKKIVVADYFILGVLKSKSFQMMVLAPDLVEGHMVMLNMFCVLAYAYFDFSAYSDIAIGISRGLGYRIRENFHFPMFAVNIRDYWKRWHISLSDWCMRNIYFPLMLKTRNSYIPLYVTMLAVGLWHALSLSWFCWALHHATGLCALTYIQSKTKASPRLLRWLIPVRILATMWFVTAGFCFVWFSDFSLALSMYLRFISAVLPF